MAGCGTKPAMKNPPMRNISPDYCFFPSKSVHPLCGSDPSWGYLFAERAFGRLFRIAKSLFVCVRVCRIFDGILSICYVMQMRFGGTVRAAIIGGSKGKVLNLLPSKFDREEPERSKLIMQRAAGPTPISLALINTARNELYLTAAEPICLCWLAGCNHGHLGFSIGFGGRN